MSDTEQSVEDLSGELLDATIESMDKKTAKAILGAMAQSCVCAMAASDVENKYHLVGALKALLGEDKFRELARNQQQLYGEPWDRWAE